MNPEEIAAQIQAWLEAAQAGEDVTEVVDTDYLEGIGRDEYQQAMDIVFDHYDVPEPAREQTYEQLDAEGDYSPQGIQNNLEYVLANDDVTNQIDNSLTIEHGAEVHYADVTQENETNVANATGDDSIGGRDQWGQFQTGDGVQVGDDNDGVVNQGDNSGQQAGDDAYADDITTGDGNFNNEGDINDSAVAFGGGSAYNEADDVVDHSVNDSYDTEDSYNTDYSGNVTDSGNAEYTETVDIDESLHADVDVDHSFNSDDDGHDIDNSYNEVTEELYD